MTTDDDLDRQIQAYLESGPAELTDRVLWAARAQLKTTRRRRSGFAWLAPWRNRHMTQNPRLWLVGASVLIIAIGVGLFGSILSRPNPEPAPVASPVAQVDAPAPANDSQAPPSSGDPAPSASAAPQPTPTPDPEAVRVAAAAAFHAAGAANLEAFRAVPFDQHHLAQTEREIAETWDLELAALKQLQVPDDTAANLRDLIRQVRRVQRGDREASAAVVGYQKEDLLPEAWWLARRHIRNRTSAMVDAANRVRAELGLPAGCNLECRDQGSYSYP